MATKVFVILSSGDREVALEVGLVYPLNAVKNRWMDEVKLIIFGPSEKIAAFDMEVRARIEELQKAGIDIMACKWCADRMKITATLEDALTILANEAQRIASSRALLRHDLMGRIYHLLLIRDIAKYHATYYTSVPAAYILARFALNAPNDNWKVHWDETASIADFRVAD